MIKLDDRFFRFTCKICNARSVVMRSDDIRLRTPSFSDLNSTSIIVTLICLHESGWICYRYCTVCIYKTWFRKGKKCFDFWKLQRGNPCVYDAHPLASISNVRRWQQWRSKEGLDIDRQTPFLFCCFWSVTGMLSFVDINWNTECTCLQFSYSSAANFTLNNVTL